MKTVTECLQESSLKIPKKFLQLCKESKITNYDLSILREDFPEGINLKQYDCYILGAKKFDPEMVRGPYKFRILAQQEKTILQGLCLFEIEGYEFQTTTSFFKKQWCLFKDTLAFERSTFLHDKGKDRFIRLSVIKPILKCPLLQDPTKFACVQEPMPIVSITYTDRKKSEFSLEKIGDMANMMLQQGKRTYDDWMLDSIETLITTKYQKSLDGILAEIDEPTRKYLQKEEEYKQQLETIYNSVPSNNSSMSDTISEFPLDLVGLPSPLSSSCGTYNVMSPYFYDSDEFEDERIKLIADFLEI